VRLSNGSIIEAFPNNPDTIRGPTLHVVYCDEMNFIPNDEEMYDAILFTLSTTNGKFVCSSTPWSTDSVFYKIFNHKDYEDFKRSHITWKDAVEPNGPLKKTILKKIQRQFRGDPWRWRREMEAEWAEDESVWLPQALITSCIDQALNYIDFEERARGNFFMGVDLGKYHDYSVVAGVQQDKDTLKLVHIKRFPLKTSYASVIGYIKTLCDRWKTIRKVSVDMTGVGDYIVEDMKNAGIRQVEGVKFTQPTKEKLATNLKQRMLDGVFKIPYVPVRYSSRDIDLMAELNVERFELSKTGSIAFSHPEGTHDDVFWSIALALHASRKPAKGERDAFIFY
jgi:phage FluMu gp28-like protein